MDIQKISEALVEAAERYSELGDSFAMEALCDADVAKDVISLASVMVQMINAGIVQVDADTEQEEETDGEG